MNMKAINILFPVITVFVLAWSPQTEIKQYTSKESGYLPDSTELDVPLDSIVERKLRYYITQFKGIKEFEEFYGKPLDSIRLEYKRLLLKEHQRN